MAARDVIKKSQCLLATKERDDLEQAVRLSQMAYEKCTDETILGAMIRIHLWAASCRDPEIRNFVDERRWLLSAFKADPTDATGAGVEGALVERFLVHAQRLAGNHSSDGVDEARKTLQELLRTVPLVEQAQLWLQQLDEVPHTKIELVRTGSNDTQSKQDERQ